MAVGLTCEAVHKSMSENYDPQTQKRHPKVPFFCAAKDPVSSKPS